MQRLIMSIAMMLSVSPIVRGAWTFTDVNPPGASSSPEIYNSGIAWRPSGDYALLVSGNGLYRYEYPSGTLTFQTYSGTTMYRAEWALDGTYAVITGNTHIYRYDHSESGFGAVTEITDIEGSGSYISLFMISSSILPM